MQIIGNTALKSKPKLGLGIDTEQAKEKIANAKAETKAEARAKASAKPVGLKKAVSLETFIFLLLFFGFFTYLGINMGVANMLNTMMNTGYQLLINTVFYIMAIAVLTGAVAGLFSEFGVVSLINKLLSPLIRPIYGLPGAATLGILSTYLSDNPAILTLAEDRNFRRYFKKYQLPALTNIGTAFGMGLIITTFIIGLGAIAGTGENYVKAALIGNLGAVIGSIVSTRLMLIKTKRIYGTEAPATGSELQNANNCEEIPEGMRAVRTGTIGSRFIESMLEGGKNGVNMGIAIVPGVLIICTAVLMLTNSPGADGNYTGAAYEGVALLPFLAEKIDFILNPLFGFSSAEAIAVPITALGAAGAAIGLIPGLITSGLAAGNDVAVFTAICMCWSGYLSTHVAMMDSLHYREMTGHAILSHTIGGLCAGIAAHYLFILI